VLIAVTAPAARQDDCGYPGAAGAERVGVRYMKIEKSAEELERLRRNDEFIDGLARDWIKYSLIAHASVEVICFQAFLSPDAAKFRPSLLVIMFCALVGLVMSAIGHILLIEGVSHFTGKVRGRLIRRKHWRFLKSIPTYGERVLGATSRWSSRLIYGSVIWLGIYLFAALNILANA
jgi:hypothetical protein